MDTYWCHCCYPKIYECGCIETFVGSYTPPDRFPQCDKPVENCNYFIEIKEKIERRLEDDKKELRKRDLSFSRRTGMSLQRLKEIREM